MESIGDIVIRAAVADDEAEVRACVEGAYAMYVERIGKPPAPMLADYSALIDQSAIRVAHDGDALAGLIVMWLEVDHLYVDNIAVHPDVQGQGVGDALLTDAEEHARGAGRDEIRLYTNTAMMENLTYYPRKGFVETHRATDDGYDRVYFSCYL